MKYLLFVLFNAFLYISCSPTGSDKLENPSKPSMVKRTTVSDTSAVEKGIDADASTTNDIVIMWYKHPEESKLEKYILYRGEEISGQIIFSNIIDINVGSSVDTVFTDENLNIGIMYYYFIIASDQNGNKSARSDTVKYQLLEKPRLEDLSIANSLTDPTSLIFRTFPFTPGASAGSILRIEEQGNTNLVYLEYINQFQNFDGIAIHKIFGQQTLQNLFNDVDDGYSYKWRIDLADSFNLPRGSESEWQEFTINWGN